MASNILPRDTRAANQLSFRYFSSEASSHTSSLVIPYLLPSVTVDVTVRTRESVGGRGNSLTVAPGAHFNAAQPASCEPPASLGGEAFSGERDERGHCADGGGCLVTLVSLG